jgi:hypothetical protein
MLVLVFPNACKRPAPGLLQPTSTQRSHSLLTISRQSAGGLGEAAIPQWGSQGATPLALLRQQPRVFALTPAPLPMLGEGRKISQGYTHIPPLSSNPKFKEAEQSSGNVEDETNESPAGQVSKLF